MTDKLSLLLELSYSDYNAVIDELRLIKSGIEFHYAIDLFDISEYCYPFGLNVEKIKESTFKKHIDFVADEQYAMYQLFNNKKAKVLLLDEYLVELLYFKKFIKYATENGIELVNTLKKYEDEFHDDGRLNIKSEKEFEDLIQTKLSLILSYLIDFSNSGIEKLISLFLKKQILLNSQDFSDTIADTLVKQAFENNRGGKLTDDILNVIWKNESEYDKSTLDRNVRYIARKRDARVIDRIFNANKYLLEQAERSSKPVPKQVVLYFSSTDTSKTIFQNELLVSYFPIVNNIRINPLRNKAQVFIKSLCMTNNDVDTAIKNVEYLRDKILGIKKYKDLMPLQHLQMDITSYLNKKFNYYREKFENYVILNQYQKIAELVEGTIKKIESSKAKSGLATEIIPVLYKIIRLGEQRKVETLQNIISLDNWENQIKYFYYVRMAIENLGSQNIVVRFNLGKDHVKSVIHHLPIIYYLQTKDFKEIVKVAAQHIIDPNAKFQIGDLKRLTVESYNKSLLLMPSLQERLVKAFILMLIPNNDEVEDTDELVYEWTKNILYQEIVPYSDRDSISLIEADYRYFIAWASRRCGKYEESQRILFESQGLFPDDARYYHGLCLTGYCIYQEKKQAGKSLKARSIEQCIEWGVKAISIYQRNKRNPIINKTRVALHNTIAYLYTELFSLKSDYSKIDLIQTSRFYLNELKKKEPDYKKYSEYLHTEATICLLEFEFIIFNLKNVQDRKMAVYEAYNKINSSFFAIVGAINEASLRPTRSNLEKYQFLLDRIVNLKSKFEKDNSFNTEPVSVRSGNRD